MSESTKARLVVTVMMALIGGAFFFGFLAEDMGRASDPGVENVGRGLVLRYIVAMAIGGALAGALCAGLFGHGGVTGWLRAVVGAVLASLLAGLIGSAIGQLPDMAADGLNMTEVISIGFGLVLIPLAMVGQPVMVAVWAALSVATHLMAHRVRGAR
ncbi:hypothetical protein [Marinibacterium sp. SX1]|uniref:hypothetical protein n=1 Tax=Marinibacterium sp. SX1 TaxID=3388424 RepID=UPI003D16CF57